MKEQQKHLEELLMILIMEVLNSLFLRRIIVRLNKKNKIFITAFCYENDLTYPVFVSNEKFENCMDLLFIKIKISHIMSISKILTALCVIRKKHK